MTTLIQAARRAPLLGMMIGLWLWAAPAWAQSGELGQPLARADEPAATDPGATDPGATDAAATNPAPTQPALRPVTLSDLNRAIGDWRFYCNNNSLGDFVCVATTRELGQADPVPRSASRRQSSAEDEDLLFVACSRLEQDLRVIFQPGQPERRSRRRRDAEDQPRLVMTLQADAGRPIVHPVIDQSDSMGGAQAYMPIPADIFDTPADRSRVSLQKRLVLAMLQASRRLDISLSRGAEVVYEAQFSVRGAYQALALMLYQCQINPQS